MAGVPKQTVFYSWQSDLSADRSLLKTAIEKAIRRINKDDASRHVELDEATRDTPGSPNIAETIFKKISVAGIVVADLTAIVTEPRYQPNANVVFETGYATAKLGESRVIMVVNEAHSSIKSMPFDLGYRRALGYTWQEGDDKAEARERLAADLTVAIRVALPPAVPPIGPPPQELPAPKFLGARFDWTFPRVQLSAAEATWLRILAIAFDAGTLEPNRVLFRQYREQLGTGFDPAAVNRAMVTDDRMFTPLGLWHVDPDTPWLTRVDIVFRYIKQLLEHNPRLTELSVDTLATKLRMSPVEVSKALHLLRATHGWALAGWSSSSDPEDAYPSTMMGIRLDKDFVLNFYERFNTLGDVIKGTLLAPTPPRKF